MATLRVGDFKAGEPVELSLKYTSFRHVAGAFGPQAMLKTSLGTLYLDPELASNIETQMRDLAIAPGEKIRVTRLRSSRGGYGWEVQRIEPALEEQLVKSLEARGKNGHSAAGSEPPETTSVIDETESKAAKTNIPGSEESTVEVAAIASAPKQDDSRRPAPPPSAHPVVAPTIPPGTAKLMACYMQAIDAMAEAQTYCSRKGLGITFTSEDIRATAISYWISCTRDGGSR